MTQPPNGPVQYAVHPQVAAQFAEQLISSDQRIASATPDVRVPLHGYLQDAIQTAAARAVEDVRSWGLDANRGQEGVRRFDAYRDSWQHGQAQRPAGNHPANGLGQQAIASAPWANQVGSNESPIVQAYVQVEINNAVDRARQDVQNWYSGKPAETSPGIAAVDNRVEAHRAQQAAYVAGVGANAPQYTSGTQQGQGQNTQPLAGHRDPRAATQGHGYGQG